MPGRLSRTREAHLLHLFAGLQPASDVQGGGCLVGHSYLEGVQDALHEDAQQLLSAMRVRLEADMTELRAALTLTTMVNADVT